MKITKINNCLKFDNGMMLDSIHETECCESHWLDFDYVKLEEVADLEFDLTNDNFFKKIDGYGIELIPLKGYSVKIPGYGSNNGYYSSDLTLVVRDKNGKDIKSYDVSECQTNT